jgi:hypothetical protein
MSKQRERDAKIRKLWSSYDELLRQVLEAIKDSEDVEEIVTKFEHVLKGEAFWTAVFRATLGTSSFCSRWVIPSTWSYLKTVFPDLPKEKKFSTCLLLANKQLDLKDLNKWLASHFYELAVCQDPAFVHWSRDSRNPGEIGTSFILQFMIRHKDLGDMIGLFSDGTLSKLIGLGPDISKEFRLQFQSDLKSDVGRWVIPSSTSVLKPEDIEQLISVYLAKEDVKNDFSRVIGMFQKLNIVPNDSYKAMLTDALLKLDSPRNVAHYYKENPSFFDEARVKEALIALIKQEIEPTPEQIADMLLGNGPSRGRGRTHPMFLFGPWGWGPPPFGPY